MDLNKFATQRIVPFRYNPTPDFYGSNVLVCLGDEPEHARIFYGHDFEYQIYINPSDIFSRHADELLITINARDIVLYYREKVGLQMALVYANMFFLVNYDMEGNETSKISYSNAVIFSHSGTNVHGHNVMRFTEDGEYLVLVIPSAQKIVFYHYTDSSKNRTYWFRDFTHLSDIENLYVDFKLSSCYRIVASDFSGRIMCKLGGDDYKFKITTRGMIWCKSCVVAPDCRRNQVSIWNHLRLFCEKNIYSMACNHRVDLHNAGSASHIAFSYANTEQVNIVDVHVNNALTMIIVEEQYRESTNVRFLVCDLKLNVLHTYNYDTAIESHSIFLPRIIGFRRNRIHVCKPENDSTYENAWCVLSDFRIPRNPPPWKVQRLLWIANLKSQDPRECYLSLICKDNIRDIISYCWTDPGEL